MALELVYKDGVLVDQVEVPDEPTENVVATSIVDIRSAASRLSSTGPTHAALMAIADALEVLVQ